MSVLDDIDLLKPLTLLLLLDMKLWELSSKMELLSSSDTSSEIYSSFNDCFYYYFSSTNE